MKAGCELRSIPFQSLYTKSHTIWISPLVPEYPGSRHIGSISPSRVGI